MYFILKISDILNRTHFVVIPQNPCNRFSSFSTIFIKSYTTIINVTFTFSEKFFRKRTPKTTSNSTPLITDSTNSHKLNFILLKNINNFIREFYLQIVKNFLTG